ncbi:PREDICTED: metal tolerance protein B-like [Populus euphratica]|uniref:Metal tolerance protein B-like n=1 Tax=Populus euphratica TaxID=75702 RepID=A0AAJ6XUY6_POPEU|nr:PREDICTED: metal tolerance protein B-like [Populus euphratica]XP_011032232.1 PREDICTED: metal tolerance protein B-like [Populus euphratica]
MEHEEVSILRSEDLNDIEMAIASKERSILPIEPQLTYSPVCTFNKQESFTVESEERSKSAMKLSGLIIFYLIVMAVEVIGGVKANSLAVITDAAHLLTDVAGFSVSLFTVWATGWEATSHQSFGYGRLEVLGALLSVQLIWLISGFLIYEAIDRILHKNAGVNGGLMFAIALFGFIINFIMVVWLGHDHSHHACHVHNHDHTHNHEREDLCAADEGGETKLASSSPVNTKILNINIQGAYLHVMADLIQSVGVMIAGAVIWAKPDWLVVDLICTLLFSTFVLFTTLPMLRDIFCILMESTPREISVSRLESGLKCIKGVQDVHNVHVWSLTVGKPVFSCHVIAEPGASSTEILHRIWDYCERTHRIHNVTVQIE